MKKQPTDISIRLQQILSEKNIRPIELSEKTGIPKSSISQYLSGYSKPNAERIYLICNYLEINEAWLLGYDVPKNKIENTAPQGLTLTDKEIEILSTYKALNDIGKSKAEEYLFDLAENKKYTK